MADENSTGQPLQDELADMRRRFLHLQRYCGDLDTFTYTIAHDLKRPLALILGHVELLIDARETTSQDEVFDSLAVIRRAGRRMDGIIDDLMLQVHLRDQESVKITPLDMDAILDEALSRLDFLIQRREVEIKRPTAWPRALGYAPWVEEIWYVFLSQTLRVDASPLSVDIDAVEQDGTARFWLSVSDGTFKPQQQAQMAQLYGNFRPDLVKRILEKLGGTFGAQHESGRGGEFYFTLPCAGDAA